MHDPDCNAVARVALKLLSVARDDGAKLHDVVRALELVNTALRLELKEARVERSARSLKDRKKVEA